MGSPYRKPAERDRAPRPPSHPRPEVGAAELIALVWLLGVSIALLASTLHR